MRICEVAALEIASAEAGSSSTAAAKYLSIENLFEDLDALEEAMVTIDGARGFPLDV